MAKKKKYKYDLAISFAEEERDIAALLDTVFRLRKFKRIHAFYYPKFKSELLGEDLDKVLPVIYEEEAKYALIILSDKYLDKNYCKIELEAIKKRRNVQETRYAFVIRKDKTKLTEIGFPKGFVYYHWDHDAEDLADTLLEILGQKRTGNRWRKAIVSLAILLLIAFGSWFHYGDNTNSAMDPIIIFQDTLPTVYITDKRVESELKPVIPTTPLFLRDITPSPDIAATLFIKTSNASEKRELASVIVNELQSLGVKIHLELLNPSIITGNNFTQLMNGNSGVLAAHKPQDKLDYIVVGKLRTTAQQTPRGLFWRELILEVSILDLQNATSEYQSFTTQATSGSHDNAYREAFDKLLTKIKEELNYEF